VWGIDIGVSALKALRCHIDDEGDVVADSYDFIEYPKALSLPDADEESLVNEALDTFLSRNDLRGDYVGMTVAGQSGLSRFFKPPPVDSRTLPEIVKYEVRQQIPFPIEDVIWDWQGLGGTEMDNVIVDAEVGLFAIKRDTVYSALQPFLRKDIEIDLVQLSPLAAQNVVCREVLPEIPEGEIDMDNLPDSIVILSMGTDATDLIVTNGVKLWLRNIPIGGNHFTKELSRELKLTHAKAEHLKRNARQAEDPKTVFQAMRRVFNDLKKEIDRSLAYYAGMDKNANLERIVLLGNAALLPGLRQYLNKQLEMDIAKIGSYEKLQGPVVDERVFKENILSFAPAYGLCLQGLDKARIETNLLPVEFVNERIIRAKKPWVLASVSLLMLALLFSYFFANQRWWGVNEEFALNGVSWKQATDEVDDKVRDSGGFKIRDEEQSTLLGRINAISAELSEASETQAAWPEFLSAMDQLLPRDPRMIDEEGKLISVANPDEIPFVDREEFYIDHIETKFFDDVVKWTQTPGLLDAHRIQQGQFVAPKPGEKKRSKYANKTAVEYEISGPGFVVEIQGHHFFNSQEKRDLSIHGYEFVRERMLNELKYGTVRLVNAAGAMEDYQMQDVGVYYPTLVMENDVTVQIPNPNFGVEGRERTSDDAGDERGERGGGEQDSGANPPQDDPSAETEVQEFFTVRQYDFIVQMLFIPTSPADRDQAKADRLAEEAKEAAENPTQPADVPADDQTPVTPAVEENPEESTAAPDDSQEPATQDDAAADQSTQPAADSSDPAPDPNQPEAGNPDDNSQPATPDDSGEGG
ncbi:MAG: pilus assembly protein PilM, partial [Pirellulaceae bacterium]